MTPWGEAVPFAVDARKREALLSGLDEIAQTLQRAAEIAAWQAKDRAAARLGLGQPQPRLMPGRMQVGPGLVLNGPSVVRPRFVRLQAAPVTRGRHAACCLAAGLPREP